MTSSGHGMPLNCLLDGMYTSVLSCVVVPYTYSHQERLVITVVIVT